ncbi:MAG: hypothetical protein WEB00_13070 [Dehalococcoidia bacterium]
MDEPEELTEPVDYPQQQREWRGGWWSVVFPLLLLGVVLGALLLYFWLS